MRKESEPLETLDVSHPEFANLSSEILESGKDLRFTAHGSSMVPFIYDGDVLTVQHIDPTVLTKGNVVFYKTQGNALMAHRVIKVHTLDGKEMFSTRGDGSPGSEEVIDADQVIGVVVSVLHRNRMYNLNHGPWKTMGYLWAQLHPLPYLTYRFIRKIGSIFQRSASN